ncbi:hypothetical protein ACFLQ4_01015 [Bacteroidota bacterium]
MSHRDQNEKSELFKILEYVKFLLNEIDKFKDDYEITEEEINTFKNEIVRFKKLAQSNNKLPDEVITDILNLKFDPHSAKRKLKFYIRFKKWREKEFENSAHQLNEEIIENVKYDLNKIFHKVLLIK